MKAHLIGGGLASLAAAASLIRDGGLLGTNIAIYKAGKTFGGAMSVSGAPSSGYVLPTGRLFEKEYRCAFELFSFIPAVSDPQISIRDEIFAFNERYGYYDKVRIIDREDNILKSGHFGLSIQDRLNLVKLLMTPELMLSGRQIKEFFSDNFFQTEFWILWTTLMGSLPQHSAMEMRRFMCRFLHILPELSTMSTILRTRYNQERCDREADRQLAPATS